jgi:hypothetical protein
VLSKIYGGLKGLELPQLKKRDTLPSQCVQVRIRSRFTPHFFGKPVGI